MHVLLVHFFQWCFATSRCVLGGNGHLSLSQHSHSRTVVATSGDATFQREALYWSFGEVWHGTAAWLFFLAIPAKEKAVSRGLLCLARALKGRQTQTGSTIQTQ